MVDVGLDYLTLDRTAATLSGGEAQRIRLATQIGSQLMGVLYILDEPSIGLHQRDNARLIGTLLDLRDLGNTVLVVEHDEETMRAADWIVDLGPGAGEHGGSRRLFGGRPTEFLHCPDSLTAAYLRGEKSHRRSPPARRPGNGEYLVVRGAQREQPQEGRCALPAGQVDLRHRRVRQRQVQPGGRGALQSAWPCASTAPRSGRAGTKASKGIEHLDKVIDIDQSPIGRTPRSQSGHLHRTCSPTSATSSPACPDAKMRGYKPGRFSFNVKGGRCEACQGDGIIRIEMQFLPDVYVPCEVCHGQRYNRETLEIKYKGKSIADVLDMTVDEALEFFQHIPPLRNKLETLTEVGLGYVKLGQPATTLSGGEAQRVKLSKELSRRATGKTLYILDEPTTGLHFEDMQKLLKVLARLVDQGNTVVVIEHNLDVIKSADWLIDMGPEGGDAGGYVIAEGTPEHVARVERSYTGQFLSPILAGREAMQPREVIEAKAKTHG